MNTKSERMLERETLLPKIGRLRKQPSHGGTTILFARELRVIERNLVRMRFPLPDNAAKRRRFFTLCSALVWGKAKTPALCDFPWVFEEHPLAFCFTILKLSEALYGTCWPIEPRKLAKPRRAISDAMRTVAMGWMPGDLDQYDPHEKQTKAEENAAAEVRRRADRVRSESAIRFEAAERMESTKARHLKIPKKTHKR